MITDTRADGTGNAMAGVVPDGPISGVLAQNWWVTCSISCADAWIWEANPLAASTNDHGAVPDIKPPEFVSLFGWGRFSVPACTIASVARSGGQDWPQATAKGGAQQS
jgi:hypothetical protein